MGESKHKHLDEALLFAIEQNLSGQAGGWRSGSKFADLLTLPAVQRTAIETGRHQDHILNGRLQYLRKQGKVTFGDGRWHRVKS